MASLKSIIDLPITESTEGVNLIVEDNGVAKRIAADAAGLGAAGTSDAVQYIEQELTEEQQMQARKNLGLYGQSSTLTDEFEITLGESSASHYLSFGDFSGGAAEGKQIKVVLSQNGLVRYTLTGTVEYQGNPVYNYMFTVQTDNQRFRLQYMFGDWTNDGIHVINGTYQVAVYLVDVTQIPEDYIPDTIARKSAIPSMTPANAVADAAGETVTSEEFNALLASLRNARILNR